MPRTDEDVLRELLHRATDDLHAAPAVTAGIVTGHHRRIRNNRVMSLATVSSAAAALVAAAVVSRAGPSAAPPSVRLTAARVLDQLSVAAGRAPQPAGRYVTLTEYDGGYDGAVRMTVFDGLTGDIWSYQLDSDGPSTSPVAKHWSPTRAEFAAWPTNPAKLRALLLSQGKQAGAGVQGPTIQGTTPDDLVFQEATNWLWDPLLRPALRAAMYKVLAATPGVTVKNTTDVIDRPAIEISPPRDSNDRYTTFESPGTGAVLEQDFGDGPPAVYTSVTSYATLPASLQSGLQGGLQGGR